ncbi:uncharacterized protein SRS1_14899 [Sporisorium reilianum f. sp. reilianum]|uniref:Uncharacterized protein n=1 Tax=Sporisorium reilianum f. sp. reilianum TaxID=72559 RepID=A0A2N8UHL3_9BASI|nr:uncharacterized protein SRS1_14899 [Sporisorium reilianum f. sp. reilianum]
MQAFLSDYSRSDDESEATYDSFATAISTRYLPADHKVRALHRYVSDTHLRAQHRDYTLDLPPSPHRPAPRRQPIVEPSTYPHSLAGRAAQHATILKAGTYLEMFPMPNPRAANGGLSRADLAPPEVEELDVTRDGGAMEAAWDDESCIDGFTPRMDASERFAEQDADEVGAMQDRFEVDALRRQVEQLQMALQLQSQQLARVESEKQVHLRPRLSQRSQQASLLTQALPTPPPTGPLPPPQQSPRRAMQSVQPVSMHAALLKARPSTASAVPMPFASTHYAAVPTPSEAAHRNYYERPATASTISHPFADRHEAETSHSISPSPSTNPTLVDGDRFDHLNRKVAELEMLIEAINVNCAAAVPAPQSVPVNRVVSRAASTPDSAAFQFNTTHAPSLTPASSIRSSSSTIPTPKEKKGGKLAAALGLKKSAASSSGSSVNETAATRVSWSRKRTEKVAQPKAKVRQGPGRGRMVIREPAA